PHLLPGDDPLVPLATGACSASSPPGSRAARVIPLPPPGLDVWPGRARLRLGEALAPDLLRGQDRRQVALLLIRRPPGHDRRPRQQEAEDVGGQRRAGPAELLEEDRRLRPG